MAEEIGKIKYTVSLDTSQFDSGMDNVSKKANETATKSNKAFETFKTGAKKAAKVATAALVGGFVAITKKSIDLYADYEQLTGGVEKLFGKSGKKVEKYAMEAFKTAGLSANNYMETVTGFSASLISSLNGDTAKAADVANQAIKDMSDNANTFGTSMESIQYAYQGFAKQNYTMLDNLKLGYGGTASEMARLINDTGVMGKTFKATSKNINEVGFDKIIAAIHKVQENQKIAGTTAKEAAGTISGSASSAKAAWENLLTTFGTGDVEATKDAVDDFAESLGNLVTNVVERIPVILEGIGTAYESIVEKIGEQHPIIASFLQALPAILTTIITMMAVIKIQAAVTAASFTPLTLVITAIGLLAYAVISNWSGISAFFGNMIGQIGAFFKGLGELVGNIVKNMIDAFGRFFKGVGETVEKIRSKIVGTFQAIAKTISGIWSNLVGTVRGFGVKIGEAVGGAIKGAINGVLSMVEGVLNTPINAINGLLDVINKVPGVDIKHLDTLHLPRLASGGIVPSQNGGHVIMAGEAGEDEWVVPESKMADMVEQLTSRTNGFGSNVTINVSGIYATSETAKREVATDIWNKLQEVNKSRFGAMGI